MPRAIGEWKVCSACGKTKHIHKFGKHSERADGRNYACKDCKNARSRAWKKDNRDRVSEYNKQYKQEHRDEMLAYHKQYEKKYRNRRKELAREIKDKFFDMYGNECSCCGEHRREFLTAEHLNGQVGVKEKELGIKSYKKALEKYLPSVYDVLCMNCNFSKGIYGYCPHENER